MFAMTTLPTTITLDGLLEHVQWNKNNLALNYF